MNVVEKVSAEMAKRIESVATLARLMPQFIKLDAVLKKIGDGWDLCTMMHSDQILVCVRVKRVKDIQPLLELLEVGLDVEFDKTHDAAQAGWRQFECANAKWLRVDAELIADGPGCQRVIKGYEQVPVYEIQCLEEIDPPAHIEHRSTPLLESV